MSVRRVVQRSLGLLGLFGWSCLPRRDLDATAQGTGSAGVLEVAGSNPGGDTAIAGSKASGGTTSTGGLAGATASAGKSSEPQGGGDAAGAADVPSAGAPSAGAPSTEPLTELPAGLPDSPVTGDMSASADASWEVNGLPEPAFQVITPSATYFLLKKSGMLVSMVDNFDASGEDWISYSDSFRPHRGLPNFGGCCQLGAAAQMTTTLDSASHTTGHVRLLSISADEAWSLVWDFYRSHVTVTVNRAAQPFSFNYRGAPGGLLDSSDRIVFSSGESHAALDALLSTKLPDEVQWLYLADDMRKRSLFVLQFAADSLTDAYGVADLDTSVLTLGNARLNAPLRFSLGLIDSTVHSVVQARVNYVIGATPAK
jgi:hypothetical protein